MSMTVFGSDKIRKARKKHRCWYCDREIPLGSTYRYRRGVDGGEFWDMHMHQSCDEIAKRDWQPEDYEYRDPSEFREAHGIP